MASVESPKILEVDKVRAEFPILEQETRSGVMLVYLDSAATSQKPRQVIDAVQHYYQAQNANIHRGIHKLAEEATAAYESARRKIADFIGARSPREIIFTRNATEAINLVSQTWGRTQLAPGDTVLLTEMEHHANIVPWQILAAERELDLQYVPVSDEGRLDLEAYEKLLSLEPRLVGLSQMSNVLGTINPIREMTALAQQAGAVVLVDGAQSVPHIHVDVRELDIDFLAFSGHKMCGPTGVGVLYGREELLESMPPFLGGGDMIKRVSLEGFEVDALPYKFEAGTPAIAQGIGLGAAVDFLSQIGMEDIHRHEQTLTSYALDRLAEVPGLRLVGPGADMRGGVVSFTMMHAHPHDVAQILDSLGIAVRAGHHCAMPLHEKFGLHATTRASFYLYNTTHEVDALITGLNRVNEIFG
jgi:cysteine desulfurase/selenocysteine lyase